MAKRKSKTQSGTLSPEKDPESPTFPVAGPAGKSQQLSTESTAAIPPAPTVDEPPPPATSPIVPGVEPQPVRRPNPATVNPFVIRNDIEAGVRLLEDRRFRQMQIAFDQRPSDDVRYEIGNEGYRWRSQDRVWTKQLDTDKPWQTRADAEALFDRVSEMIREEKGIGHQR